MARIKKSTMITNSTRIAATFAKGTAGADVYFLDGHDRADMAIITVAVILAS